ncbi:serine hydrolase [Oceanobacillus halotolerans]|uniref:serine hydrolase n=1 Tax=Oceanobacillus halotolerans TaxID=2663380 RepID=UPI0013DA98C9|nr:serine hydrolase [Oceanobacillus halotolerans]
MKISELEKSIENCFEDIQGEYSIVIEIGNNQISLNGNKKMPAASIIKIPILMEGYRVIENKKFSEMTKIRYLEEDKVGGMGVLNSLASANPLAWIDILTLMIIVSDNTAANLAIKNLGFSEVNRLCEEAGCKNTDLGRYFMDMEAIKKGSNNYTSANDMVFLLKEIVHGNLLSDDSKASILRILKHQQFNTKLPGLLHQKDIPGSLVMAHKTGELPGVEHDVGILEYKEEKVYIAVLLSDLSSNCDGQKAIAQIGELVYRFLKSNY